MTRLRPFSFLALAAFAAAAFADDPSAETFRRAELADRASGDLARAAELYKEAALRAPDADTRAVAEVRAASCLRRLGRGDEARALLAPWVAESAPADVRRAADAELGALGVAAAVPSAPEHEGPPSLREQLARKERELDDAHVALEFALAQQSKYEDIAKSLKEREDEVKRLRAEAAAAADPTSADEVLERRKRDIARQRDQDQRTARVLLATARLLRRDGRFVEARNFLYDAEAADPGNAEVRALLSSLSAPLGAREALFERTLEVAALAREVRGARITAEVTSLADEARRRQAAGDFAGSAAPLAQALAWIDAAGDLVRDGRKLRDDVAAMQQAASARGVERARVPTPALQDDEKRWAASLRGLLEEAGGEVASGLLLRFHDVGSALASSALPPVPEDRASTGWALTAADVSGTPLLAQYVRGDERSSFSRAGAALRATESTLVALADAATQQRIALRISSLRSATPSAELLRAVAFRADRADVDAALARRGITPNVVAVPGARSATLAAAEVAPFLLAAAPDATQTMADATLRATPLRPFRLTVGSSVASLLLDVLPVAGAARGVAIRATTVVVSPSHTDGPPLRSESMEGGPLAAGGALVLYGLPDPERAGGEVAVLVRVGAAPAPGQQPPGTTPRPTQAGAAEIELPQAAASAEDQIAPPDLVPEHPIPGRREALLRRVRDAVRDASFLDLRGERIVVTGQDAVLQAAHAFLGRLAAAPASSAYDVRLFQVTPAIERELVQRQQRLTPAASNAFSWVILRNDEERRVVEARIRLVRGELPLLAPPPAAAPTARTGVSRIVRTSVTGADGVPTWAEEGLVVSMRTFDRGADGRVALDLSLRARWFAAQTADERPLAAATWWGDVATALGRGESLLVVGARSPFATSADADRLVVLVRARE